MNKSLMSVLLILFSFLANQSVFAKSESDSEDFTGLPTSAYDLSTSQTEISPNTENTELHEERQPFLPFFAQAARERGYELPEPFGINANYMNIHQDILVHSIAFEGLSLNMPDITIKVPIMGGLIHIPVTIIEQGIYPIPSDIFEIGVKSTRQKNHTETLRLDTWLFPFMNVYGVVGHTRGSSVSKISVHSSVGFIDQIMQSLGPMDDLDFVLKFKGTTYGLGTTLAGGVGNWFGLVDLNYTKTKLNIIEGNIKAFTLSPRVGYRFSLPAVNFLHLPESKFSLWVGAMYQNVQQDFKGKLSNLKFSSSLQQIINTVNWNNEGRFHVKQHLKSPWNMLTGCRWEVTKNFNVLTEIGYLKRKSFFLSAEVRF